MKSTVLALLSAASLMATTTAEIVESMKAHNQEWTTAVAIHKAEREQMLEQNRKYYTQIYQSARLYYKDFLANMWGMGNVKLPEKKAFTQYSDDLKSRETVDYEKGTVTLEVVTEPDAKVTPEVFNKKLEKLADEDLKEAQTKDPVGNLADAYMKKKQVIEQEAPVPVQPTPPKLIEKDTLQKTAVSQADIKEKTVTLKDGKKQKIVSVTVPMVPDHLARRAERFKPLVFAQAKRFGLRPSYVFGVMQTESYFNPLAVSPIPAYGLMQIVPGSAGLDAYLALSGKRKLLPPPYLYDAKNNVELGSQYLKLLRTRYLRGIKDPVALDYCTASAYNAGMGNVYRAFTGKMKRKAAIEKINSMSRDEVYKTLRTSARLTEEAHNYVQRVRDYSQNYVAWDAEAN